MRPAPAPGVVAWFDGRNDDEVATTAVTVAEIFYGVERLPRGRRRTAVGDAADDVFRRFSDRVLAFDADAAAAYAEIVTVAERAGRPIGGFDAQIAAICRVHGAALCTRNVRDFVDAGIEVVDPWPG